MRAHLGLNLLLVTGLDAARNKLYVSAHWVDNGVKGNSGVEDGISIDTQVNNIRGQGQGWVKTDANGDIYFDHRGSGAAALTVDIKIIGIEP